MSQIAWIPLESNPDVLNNYIDQLGIESNWRFVDIWGFDEDFLAYFPQTAVALILLFPITDNNTNQDVNGQPIEESKYYFIKQTIMNACGTIAIIHSIANNLEKIDFKSNSSLRSFIEKTQNLKSLEKAEMLEKWVELENLHHECAQDGQSFVPQPEQSVDLHFIAFINKDGTIYEFDGRKSGPVPHGETTDYDFLINAGKVCKKFISKNPDSLRFTAVALVKCEP